MENIVLVTYDSLRADHCGFMGYPRNTTPTIDKLAAEGATFKKAISPAAGTNASMSGIFTGRSLAYRDSISNPNNSKSHLNIYGTLAESLSDKGYTTGAFCPNAFASRYFGFDRGFDDFYDFMFTNDKYQSMFEKHVKESGLYTTLRNLRNFVFREEAFRSWDTYINDIDEWVENVQEPYFLWVFIMDTHFPHLTPRGYRNWSNLPQQYYYNFICNMVLDDPDVSLSQSQINGITNIYDDSIRWGDEFIDELISTIGDTDPSVVIHADHGESLGEHNYYGHYFQPLYNENIHVPFVVWNSESEFTTNRPFSLLNTGDLIEDISQHEPIDPGKYTQNSVYASAYDGHQDRKITAVVGEKNKMIKSKTEGGSEEVEFYNIESDPKEKYNLDRSANPDIYSKYNSRINEIWEREEVLVRAKTAFRDIDESQLVKNKHS